MLLKDKYNCDKYVSIFVRHSCICMCLYLEIATEEDGGEMVFNAVATVCLSFIVYQNKTNCVFENKKKLYSNGRCEDIFMCKILSIHNIVR